MVSEGQTKARVKYGQRSYTLRPIHHCDDVETISLIDHKSRKFSSFSLVLGTYFEFIND